MVLFRGSGGSRTPLKNSLKYIYRGFTRRLPLQTEIRFTMHLPLLPQCPHDL